MQDHTPDSGNAAGSEKNGEISRRDFVRIGVAGSLAAGFAVAVQPVSADAIHTDDKGLVAGEVTFDAPDGVKVPAYRAFPDKKGAFPTVVVVQEIFGVHEHIKDVCRRFAKLGYYAVAPELFFRQGDVSKLQMNEIMPIVSKVPDAQVISDIDAVVRYAKLSGKANTEKLAMTGFCWGGRIVWLYAAHNPNLKAGVAWYGRLTGQTNDLQTRTPLQAAPDLKAPVLGLYGGKDQGIPLTDVEAMRAALKRATAPAAKKSDIKVYTDSGHAFHADYRPSYNEKDAKDGWARLQKWFKDNKVA